MKEAIQKTIHEHQSMIDSIILDELLLKNIETAIELICECFKEGGKVLFCGNGGSAADAQHLAAELSGRFYLDREPLNAEALHVNTSFITAVANDHGYDQIFLRAIKAKATKGDVLMAISTSGQSLNVLNAIDQAKKMDVTVISLTGRNYSSMENASRLILSIASEDTARIQEMHQLIGHIICQEVEKYIFG